jgi:putative ABC transport system ATP-binding protein
MKPLIRKQKRTQPEAQAQEAAGRNGYLVELCQVVKTFVTPAGRFAALSGVNLQVKPGEFVSIIGKSGSGKSTLINMVTGIDRPSSGMVWVNQTKVDALSEENIAVWRGHNIGLIFQFFQLLPTLTAIENVMLPMDYLGQLPATERPDRALHLLELVDMVQYAHRLPGDLSGGQLQRIAIARALANDPPLLTADEPTGNLDFRTAENVFGLFQKLVENGKTILMVTHDPDLAQRAGRTVVIADGQIVDEQIRI